MDSTTSNPVGTPAQLDPVLMKLLATVCRQEFMKDRDSSELPLYHDQHPSQWAFNFLIRPSQRSRLLDWTLKTYQAVDTLCVMIENVSFFTELVAALVTLATFEAELKHLKGLVGEGVREVMSKEFPMASRKKLIIDKTIFVYINGRFFALKAVVSRIQDLAGKNGLDKVELCTAFRDLGRALLHVRVTPEDLKRTYKDAPNLDLPPKARRRHPNILAQGDRQRYSQRHRSTGIYSAHHRAPDISPFRHQREHRASSQHAAQQIEHSRYDKSGEYSARSRAVIGNNGWSPPTTTSPKRKSPERYDNCWFNTPKYDCFGNKCWSPATNPGRFEPESDSSSNGSPRGKRNSDSSSNGSPRRMRNSDRYESPPITPGHYSDGGEI